MSESMGTTWKEACELIARWRTAATGELVTGEDVFNYSDTGELFMIPEWYAEAQAYFQGEQERTGGT